MSVQFFQVTSKIKNKFNKTNKTKNLISSLFFNFIFKTKKYILLYYNLFGFAFFMKISCSFLLKSLMSCWVLRQVSICHLTS